MGLPPRGVKIGAGGDCGLGRLGVAGVGVVVVEGGMVAVGVDGVGGVGGIRFTGAGVEAGSFFSVGKSASTEEDVGACGLVPTETG